MWARVLLLAMTACFSPRPPAGAPCPDGDSCPAGQRCVANVCIVGDPDLDPDARIASDGAPDGAADAPGPRWSIVASEGRGTLGGSGSLSLTMPASGEGHLILVAVETDLVAAAAVDDDAGNTYAAIPNSRAQNTSGQLAVELWFVNDSNAGATSITATAAAGQEVRSVVAWEVAGLAKSNPIDTVNTVDDQAASTTPAGASLTTASDGEFVISIAIVGSTVSGLTSNSAFTQDHNTLGNGWAHLTAVDAPAGTYQAAWNQMMSRGSCATSIAFRIEP